MNKTFRCLYITKTNYQALDIAGQLSRKNIPVRVLGYQTNQDADSYCDIVPIEDLPYLGSTKYNEIKYIGDIKLSGVAEQEVQSRLIK